MSCSDIPSLLDLQKAKLNVDDLGRLMGAGTGTSTNEVTGQVRPTYNKVIDDMNSDFNLQLTGMGYSRVGTFKTGYTLSNTRQTLLWDLADGGDGQEYGWSGSFSPAGKVVPPNSTPINTGGIAVGAWMSRFDPELKNQIIESTGESNLDDALAGMAVSAYAIKNRKLLGVANNLIRSGASVKVACVGDSITYGYDETSSDSLPPVSPHVRKKAPIQYPSRLQDRLNLFANSTVTVVNMGFSGDTAKQGYNRWVANPSCDVAHIMYGINDAAGALGATFDEYCEYIEKLIRRYIDWGHGVVIHTSTAQQFNNRDAGGARYTQYARCIAEMYGCAVFESEGVHQYCRYASVYSDSTHFNKAGYAKYGDAVASFILAGGWARPVRGISAVTMQQPGRATEGIGWFGTGGAYTSFNEQFSYVWNGQTGGILANSDGVHSFSFYLDSEAANVFAVGLLDGARICMSDPVTTVDGNTATNTTPKKSAVPAISETTSYVVSNRQQGFKQWAGALVGRGWKTVYFQNLVTNSAVAFINELVIEPCAPELISQTNGMVMPATKEVYVFNWPVQPIGSSALPEPQKMPLKVYMPLPRGLYRQSQAWTNFYDNLVVDISIATRVSSGGSSYDGIHKITAFTTTSLSGANLGLIETIFKSNIDCITPSSITYAWADPSTPTIINEGSYPGSNIVAPIMYLVFNFPDAPEAYYSLEVECSAILSGAGTYMY